jgi:hypothetical protein
MEWPKLWNPGTQSSRRLSCFGAQSDGRSTVSSRMWKVDLFKIHHTNVPLSYYTGILGKLSADHSVNSILTWVLNDMNAVDDVHALEIHLLASESFV